MQSIILTKTCIDYFIQCVARSVGMGMIISKFMKEYLFETSVILDK
jgi:hypothetical protein